MMSFLDYVCKYLSEQVHKTHWYILTTYDLVLCMKIEKDVYGEPCIYNTRRASSNLRTQERDQEL